MSKTRITNGIIDFVFFIAITSLVFFGYKNFKRQKEHLSKGVIVVNFWIPSSYFPFDSTHGAYKKIYLTGIEKSDSLKMIEIKESLTDFRAKMDEVCGVHIVFGDNSKYGDFIKVLNYCLRERIVRYIPYKNNLWIPANENLIK